MTDTRTSRIRPGSPSATPTPAAWPEGVIARYLTVGGATVDVIETGPRDSELVAFTTVSTCTGCKAEERTAWKTTIYYYSGGTDDRPVREAAQLADVEARTWAQDHAETCRAMPKPDGAS